jgi:NodT family efflux transporter outer membrane factor (OMF) lipoprotein
MGYELDLWGGNRAAREAALARLELTEWNRAALVLALQASVAEGYFQVLAFNEQLGIAHQNMDAAQELMDLVQVRYEAGAATALDMAQQKTTLLAIQARIPTLHKSLANSRNALKVLLGGAVPVVSGSGVSSLTVPQATPGVPAALLENRPEIRAAEAGLVAANANVGAARAALLPSVELSLSAGAADVFTAGTTRFAAVAASLSQVLFNGGALRAQVGLSEAIQEELTAVYLQTVQVGVQAVEDSLVAQRAAEESVLILEQTAYQSGEAYRLALIRFEEGGEDLLSLLDAQRTRLNAEESLVLARYNRLAAVTQLVKSVGGGWGV